MATLVIGLGNPGGEYRNTRHNIGWMVLDALERSGRFAAPRNEGPAKVRIGAVEGYDLVTARPKTFMNLSGRAGVHLIRAFGVRPDDTIVIHDDVDLPLGRLRLRRGGSAGGQKGVDSLIRSWQTPEFIRVRVGVSRPAAGEDTIDHVLHPFRHEERPAVDNVVQRAAAAVIAIVRLGLEPAAAEFNRAPTSPSEGGIPEVEPRA